MIRLSCLVSRPSYTVRHSRASPDDAAEGGDVDQTVAGWFECHSLDVRERQIIERLPCLTVVLREPQTCTGSSLSECHVNPSIVFWVEIATEGLSGPATKPITLRTLAEIAKNVDLPITATGGPVTWRDAVEMMLVGAGTVQFCTAVMHYGLDIIDDLQDGLAFYLDDKGFDKPGDIVGRALSRIVSHDKLPRDAKMVSSLIEERCVKCDLCYIACRDGGHQAITIETPDRLPKIDPDKCPGCRLCVTVCPADALTIVRKQEGPDDARAEAPPGNGRI